MELLRKSKIWAFSLWGLLPCCWLGLPRPPMDAPSQRIKFGSNCEVARSCRTFHQQELVPSLAIVPILAVVTLSFKYCPRANILSKLPQSTVLAPHCRVRPRLKLRQQVSAFCLLLCASLTLLFRQCSRASISCTYDVGCFPLCSHTQLDSTGAKRQCHFRLPDLRSDNKRALLLLFNYNFHNNSSGWFDTGNCLCLPSMCGKQFGIWNVQRALHQCDHARFVPFLLSNSH